LKKIGCMDNDVMLNAYDIWKENEGTDFGLEHAWRLLKDQPKWLEQFSENCSNGAKDSQNEGQGERSRNIHQSYGPDWCGGNNERKKMFSAPN